MKRLVVIVLLIGLAIAGGYAWYGSTIGAEDSKSADKGLVEAGDPVPPKDKSGEQPQLSDLRLIAADRHYVSPLWSPDGRKLLLSAEGNKGLYLLDFEQSQKPEQINDLKGVGYNARWSQDSKGIYYLQKTADFQTLVKYFDLYSGSTQNTENLHFSGIQSYALTGGKGPIVSLRMQDLSLHAFDPSSSKSWLVTTEPGKYYNHLLSPDLSKVVTHSGVDMKVFHTDGSGLLTNLGQAIAYSWSPDSKYILAWLDESPDGHHTTGSELYLYAADGSSKWQITNSPDRVEMWPYFSADGQSIVYGDAATGKIYTAKINW